MLSFQLSLPNLAILVALGMEAFQTGQAGDPKLHSGKSGCPASYRGMAPLIEEECEKSQESSVQAQNLLQTCLAFAA